MSVTATSVSGDGHYKTAMAEMPVILPSRASGMGEKQKHPQKKVDDFWKRFTTKTPGKATTLLPRNVLADRLAKRKSGKEAVSGITAQASYEEAAALCKAKVDKIVQECRRINQKYRDPHFDLEVDLKMSRRDCLESLHNIKYDDSNSDSDSDSSFDCARPLRMSKRGRGTTTTTTTTGPGLRGVEDDGINPVDGGGGGRRPAPGIQDSPQGRTPGSKFMPRSVKRIEEIFDDPKFYIDGPTANDVRQGRDGDCWLMAALCTLSNKPGLIERICVAHNQDVGVYGFVFHRDGEWFSEIIDDKLYLTKPDYDEAMQGGPNIERILWDDRERPDTEEIYRKTYQSNSGGLYFAQCEHPNETWLPLLEKAYAKAHGDYETIEGGFTGEGIEDLTGGVTSGLFTTDILDKEYFWKEELMKVNQQFLFGCSTGLWGRGFGHRKGIMEGHAYSVMRAVEMDGERLLLLKNPWGKGEWTGAWSDGSKEWTPEWLQKLNHRFGDDGAFWISYKDLLRKYQAFDRTRLFGPDWKITSIWTTLSVPWTLEYHDTKFAFTLARPGPVVLVLSQLDDRYFRGLEGQYKFGLGIRVHKAGDDEYLVRAQTAFRMTRSVNVELELEAGEYTVLVKLDAKRQDWVKPPEDVVRENARDRREKLLRVGLSYDLAHSKAKMVETAEERAAREAYRKRKKAKQRERIRKMFQEEKERRHYQNVKALEKQRKRVKRRKEKRKAATEKKKAEEEDKRNAEEKEREEERKEAKTEKAEKIKAEEYKPGSLPGESSHIVKKERASENKLRSNGGTKVEDQEQDKAPKLETKEGSQDDHDVKLHRSGSSQWSVGEDTPTTSRGDVSPDVSKTDQKEGKSPTHASMDSGQDEISKSPTPIPPDQEMDQGGPRAGQPPEATGPTPGKDGISTGKVAGEGSAEPPNSHPEPKSKGEESVQNKPEPLSAEVDEKIRRAIYIFQDLKEELEEILPKKDNFLDHHDERHNMSGRHPPGSSNTGLFYPPHMHMHGSYMHPEFGPPAMPPPLPPPPPPPPPAGYPGGVVVNTMMSGPPPPPPPGPPSVVMSNDLDDLSSVTTLSELSERELDYHVKDHNRQARMAMRGGGQPGGPGQPPGAPHMHMAGGGLSDDEEAEKDPWNAVAVVGLRVYYKAVEGDDEKDNDKDREVVRLRVMRPNPYDWSDDEEKGNDDGGEVGYDDDEEDEDENEDRGEGEGDAREGGGLDGKDQDEGKDETKVLDLDDSAKDATSQAVL